MPQSRNLLMNQLQCSLLLSKHLIKFLVEVETQFVHQILE